MIAFEQHIKVLANIIREAANPERKPRRIVYNGPGLMENIDQAHEEIDEMMVLCLREDRVKTRTGRTVSMLQNKNPCYWWYDGDDVHHHLIDVRFGLRADITPEEYRQRAAHDKTLHWYSLPLKLLTAANKSAR